jgi:transcriptional regulator with AAA-type ATPase domain/transcriptional regulatory protein LevR
MKAQDKVFEALIQLADESKAGITATELAERLNLSRQVTSHYLTGLLKDGRAQKAGTKPVYWHAITNEKANRTKETDAFQNFVGYEGSQRTIVEQCKAAVNYPPNGLPLIINGKSGVGKSFLASLIFRYAVDRGAVGPDAPFIILNCADYANNPELLSTTLFGYKKGAFTGADKDKQGLLKQADGGYLFFDEIHRLSFENQEKLFIFMDKGQFRPIGENKIWHTANVRLIFATTEENDQVLLATFRRRIPLKIHISNLDARPFNERLRLVYHSFLQEAKKIKKDIDVSSGALNQLCFQPMEGNVGMLRNMIQLSCAHAFTAQQSTEVLKIDHSHLPPVKKQSQEHVVFDRELAPLHIRYHEETEIPERETTDQIRQSTTDFFSLLADYPEEDTARDRSELILTFKKLMQFIRQGKENSYFFFDHIGAIREQYVAHVQWLKERYGVNCPNEIIDAMYDTFVYFQSVELSNFDRQLINCVARLFPKAYYISEKLAEKNSLIVDERSDVLTLINTFYLQEYVEENIRLHGLIVAHGRHTASSIQAVANQLCHTFVFESIDMPMSTDIGEIIEKVKDYLKKTDTSDGLILLVDMGSLNRLYSSIKNLLNGDLLVINNLTTAVALDIGMKMVQNIPFKKIAEQAKSNYIIEARYFEGLTQGKNIIISCMSGVGISNKVKEMIEHYIPREQLDVLTIEYKELRDAIDRNDESYFKQTLFIITTTELPATLDVPNINIYEILEEKGKNHLWHGLKSYIGRPHFELMIQDFLKNFTIEGVSNRLSFLNPNVIINEVEHVISLYEKYYEIQLDGKVKLNLYMHIALMVERLIITKENSARDNTSVQLSDKEQEFTAVTKEIFHDIESKYNVRINGYELSLLYELLKPFIKKLPIE